MIDPPARHLRRARADEVRDAREVLPDERVLALVVHVEERGLEAAAGVVDEHVDAAHRLDPRAHGIAVTHVEHRGVRPAAGRDDRRDGGVEPVGITVADRDVGAEPGERGRDRGADPLGRAGDDRDAVRQQHRVGRERHGGRG